MSSLARSRGGVGAAVLLVLALSGCSGTPIVEADEVADQVRTQLTETVGQEPRDVTCPDDLEGEVGATLTCVLTADDGTEIDVAVEVTEVDGSDVSFDFQVADEPNR